MPKDDILLYDITLDEDKERFRRFYKKNFPNSECVELPGNHIFNDGNIQLVLRFQ